MAHDDDHRKPKAEDWGVLNAIPEPPPMEIEPMRRERPVEQGPPDRLMPSPDALVDVPIKKHRSYAGLVFLVVIIAGAVGLYFVMRTDIESEDPNANPYGTLFNQSQTISQAGAVPEDIEIAPPPAKTLLRLESDPPGAWVVVNGNPITEPTPTAVQTFAGHPARVHMYAEGRRPMSETLTVEGGERTVKLTLEEATVETGKVEVTSDPPGAFVEYRGKVVGETPVTLEGLPAEHPVFFRLKKEGHYPHTVRYTLGAGEERRVGVKMIPADGERKMATVYVDSLPLGARIDRMIDGSGKREGTTGNRPVQLFGRIGYPLVLQGSASRYGNDEAVLDVKDPSYTIMMRLPPPKKVYGKLSLTGPKGLSVYLDSEEQDALPLREVELLAGEHDLVVVDPQTRARGTAKIKIGEDETVSRTIKRADDGRITIE